MNRAVLGFSFRGGFWLMIQSPHDTLVCSDVAFLRDLASAGSVSLGIYPFLPCFPTCCSLECPRGIGCHVSSLIAGFIYFRLLSFEGNAA